MTNKKVLLSALIGSAIEFYDYSIYTYFASILALHFFPSSDKFVSIIYVFSVFAAGYLARPIGGVLLSHYVDKTGRKKILSFTLICMAISTFIIGLIPTYESIGIASTIILILARLVQGLSAAGEISSSIVFLAEHSENRDKSLFTSCTFIGISLGLIIASIVSLLLTNTLSHASLIEWGWRLGFLFGIIPGIAGQYIRTRLNETPAFEKMLKNGDIYKIPLLHALQNQKKSIFITFITSSLAGSIFYLLFVYIPTYLSVNLNFGLKIIIALTIGGLLIYIATLISVSKLINRIAKNQIIIFSLISMIIFLYPLFSLISDNSSILIISLAYIILSFMAGLFVAPISAFWMELFPANNRASGFSLGYNLGITCFGGIAPLMAAWLTKVTERLNSISFILIFLAFIILIVLLQEKKIQIYN